MDFSRATRYYRSRTPSCHTPAPPNFPDLPPSPCPPPPHPLPLHRLLLIAYASSSFALTSAASPPPHGLRVVLLLTHRRRVLLLPITRHCLADLLSQRHHQSRGGHRPRVPFAGSTVVVRSTDGVNSATVVQCSIPNACRAVLSTAAASSSSPTPPCCCASLTCHRYRRRVRLPITHSVVLRLADNLSPRCHQSRDGHRRCRAAVVVRSSSTAPTPVVSSCPQHLRTLRRLIFLRVLLRKILFFLLLLHLLCGEKTLSEAKYCC
ncbi:hypothetical protein DAI22_07g102900 [Oryza sativa Japonica Group]|nr:hypothetical protein DAI22_07g102900 [Oryza sativa Japonica Group]